MRKNGNDDQIEARLEKVGELLRSQPSVIRNSMQKIEHPEQPDVSKSASLLPAFYKTGIGLAACLMTGVFLWLIIFGSGSVTLADVQKSIGSKPWILIRYDDNTQEWVNFRKRQCFLTYKKENPYNFYVMMRDHVNGIYMAYHSNWGQQIHKETFNALPYPQTPWEYAIGAWDDAGESGFSHTIVKKINDMLGDKQVFRFDTYSIGPLDLQVLTQQVWADPETRLPVRIRKYSSPDEYDTGDFSFPETGPLSIYDLGVSRDFPIVQDAGVIEPNALAIVNAGKEALHKLPDKMQIVEIHKSWLEIYYRAGNKLRIETYGKLNDNNDLLPIDIPQSNENISQWAKNNLTLVKLLIYDGEYEYSAGIKGAPFVNEASPSIEYRGSNWMDALIPLRDQWPYINNVGPVRVLKGEPDTPPGCVLLRWEGLGLRRDWYVDTEKDYICVKKLEFRKEEDTGQYLLEKQNQIEQTDVIPLPTGQWYVKTENVTLLTDSEIEQLTGKDDSRGFFNGANMIKSEMDKGKKIWFWAK